MQRSIFVAVVTAFITTLASAQRLPRFLCGGDVSEIPQVEAAGGHFSYQGQQQDPFAIMKKAGWNFVRFRLWNDPKGGLCDKDYTLKLAKRAHDQGLNVSLDFHYSDWWADPGKQYMPAAWKSLSFDDLVKATYDYTKDVVSAMSAQGTAPVMVQVGNEITSGMLWPAGQLHGEDEASWKKLAALIDAGIRAVHDSPGGRHILTMIHLDRGGDNKGARWWFDHLAKYHVNFDLIGLSYYPYWHGHIAGMEQNVDDLARRYHKDIYLVETAYPWTPERGPQSDSAHLEAGFPASPEGQAAFLKELKRIVRDMPDHRGKGLLYWAPTWIPTGGKTTGWGTLATFDYNGNALPAVDELSAKAP